MKHFLALVACLLMFGLMPSTSQAASPDSASTEALLLELTKAKLSKVKPILEQLEQSGAEAMLPIFSVMLEGQLYYEKANRSNLLQVQKIDGETVHTSMSTGEQVETLSKSKIKKIRVNNQLRIFLRGAIARIQISAADPIERESAIMSLIGKLDKTTVEAIRARQATETDENVLAAMALASAMFDVTALKDTDERLAAVAILDGRLESDVRNKLQALADGDKDPVIAAAAQDALDGIQSKIEWYGFVDQLFFGLSLGSVLLLAAIGLAITFGVMGVINMAHGEMIMLGAYTTYVVQLLMPNSIDLSIWVAIPAAFVVSGLFGIAIERGVIRFLHGRPLETLLATFGISLILQQLVRTVFSPLNRQVDTPTWMSGSWEINPVLSLTLNRLYILAFALIVFFALMLVLKKTNLGLNVRAVSQNRAMAKAMGIRTDRVDALTFGLGSGIAGIAGVALSQLTNVGPNLGQAYIIDSFMVVVFGGVGNLLGTLVAAFSLGVANKFLEPVTGSVLASILILVFIILFIQKRPKGLFPQKGRAAE